jgi:hypothetical protein
MGALPVAEVDEGLFDGHGLSHTPGPWEGQSVSEHPAGSESETGGDSHRDGGVFLDFQVISRVALWDGRREAVRHVSDTA